MIFTNKDFTINAQILKNTLVIASMLIITACNSTSTSLSTVRLDRPEVSSQKYDTRMNMGFGGRASVELTESNIVTYSLGDAIIDSSESVSFNPSAEFVDAEAYANISTTVAPRIEISLSTIDDAKFAIKYQFYGDTSDTAKAGNYSQAISLGLARFSDDGTRVFDGFSPEVDESGERAFRRLNQDFEQETYSIDIAWINGYRAGSNFLIYGGPYLVHGRLSGNELSTFTSGNNEDLSDGTVMTNNVSLDSNGTMIGANLALEYEFDFGLFFTIESTWSRIDWEGATNDTSYYSFNFGYHF